MDREYISFDGKTIDCSKLEKGQTVLSLVDRSKGYKDNPIVAALINGELSTLNAPLEPPQEIKSVELFSPFGKRVYRKTLCFLLNYASATLFPERTLVIGHSLGDGFYFSYRNKEKPDIENLKSKMRQAIEKDMPIKLVKLSRAEALDYTRKRGLAETEKLLLSRNDSSFQFINLDGVLEVYYEPMLPSTGLLEVWDLIQYEDGMLLRYPQSRNPLKIMDFKDNKKLFSVFKENKRIAKILSLEGLGALNLKQKENKIEETIILSETLQRKRIADIGQEIANKGSIRLVCIAGPSSSGKTTFSLKLCNELRIQGYKPLKISLDDYYLPLQQVPVDENGEKDFELLEALDLDLFRTQIKNLLNGDVVHLAAYDFKERKHYFLPEGTRMDSRSIIVIEGIHGLNPKLLEDIDSNTVFRIYISALTQLNIDSCSRISTTDNRILRRMIRDNRTRNLDAVETLSRWPSVERGEKNHIFPLQNNADVMINSALEYELGVLAPYAIPLLRSVTPEDGEAYTSARRLLSFLDLIYPIPAELVPSDSLLREFIGGSIFKAT